MGPLFGNSPMGNSYVVDKFDLSHFGW